MPRSLEVPGGRRVHPRAVLDIVSWQLELTREYDAPQANGFARPEENSVAMTIKRIMAIALEDRIGQEKTAWSPKNFKESDEKNVLSKFQMSVLYL